MTQVWHSFAQDSFTTASTKPRLINFVTLIMFLYRLELTFTIHPLIPWVDSEMVSRSSYGSSMHHVRRSSQKSFATIRGQLASRSWHGSVVKITHLCLVNFRFYKPKIYKVQHSIHRISIDKRLIPLGPWLLLFLSPRRLRCVARGVVAQKT